MAQALSNLSDDELFYGFLGDYLDGELPGEIRERFVKLQAEARFQQKLEAYQNMKGKLQLELSQFQTPSEIREAIRRMVVDQGVQATQEARQIEKLERKEFWSNARRWSVVLLVIGLVIAAVVYVVMPKKQRFDALEYLAYETLALEEDPAGRIDFPSTDPAEVSQYVKAVPGLDFTPTMLQDFDEGWQVEGASFIDYDVRKVVLVRYNNKARGDAKLHHYMMSGSLNDLPPAETAVFKGLSYRIYANDRLNILVWQSPAGGLSFLVAHLSGPELADIARRGQP